MKKISLTVLTATALLFSAQNLTAQEVTADAQVEANVVVASDYTAIDISEVPALVQQALERDHEGAVISEAYVKEEDGVKTYKLVVKTAEGEEKELFADAEGNWIEEKQ